MKNDCKLFSTFDRVLNKWFLMRGEASTHEDEEDFEPGVYRVIGMKGLHNDCVLQREGTDDFYTVSEEAFLRRVIKRFD